MRNNDLTERLVLLAEALEAIDLRGAEVLGDTTAIESRDRIAGTIRSYLIPRTSTPDAPLMVVFAGPTGAGKSTLVNSVAGLDLTVAGAVRPTTSRPLVLSGSSDEGRRVAAGSGAEVVVGAAPILEHMTFVDTPDIDSTSTDHRLVAESFIDRAEIVVFVVSASRYADDAPWEVLRRAMSRGATVIPVVNRLGPGAAGITTDYASHLRRAGLDQAPVRVPEHHLEPGAQRVPAPAVRELKRRLFRVAKVQRSHQAEVLARVLSTTTHQAGELADRLGSLGEGLDEVARGIHRGMSKPPSMIPDSSRSWAANPPVRRRLPSWLQRIFGGDEIDAWLERFRHGLASELESRLRSDLAGYGSPVLARGPGLTALASQAPEMIDGVVDSWIRDAARMAETGGALGPESVISAVLCGDPAGPPVGELVDLARGDLEGKLEVVWEHFGSLLTEGWAVIVGSPDPGDLRALASDVAAAHDFADA